MIPKGCKYLADVDAMTELRQAREERALYCPSPEEAG